MAVRKTTLNVVALGAGAQLVVPHGLDHIPNRVKPLVPSPIRCIAQDATNVTFENTGGDAQSASFVVEKIHSAVDSNPSTAEVWAGLLFAHVLSVLKAASSALDFNAKKLSNIADGVAATDAATKGQLDTTFGAVTGAVKRSLTIAFGDFAALLAGDKSETLNIGAILPAGARVLGIELELNTPFTDGAAIASCDLDVGGVVADSLVDGESLLAANAGNYPMGIGSGAAGPGQVNVPGSKAAPLALYSGEQLRATVVSNVDLNTLTAGEVVVSVFYIVLP